MNFHDILMLRGFVGGGGGSGGGAKTWDDLGYSPTGGDTLTWDGNTEGLEYVEILSAYKVSKMSIDESVLSGGLSYTYLSNGVETIKEFSGDEIPSSTDGVIQIDWGHITFVPEQAILDGVTVTPGVYFVMAPDRTIYTTSLTIPGYTGFPSVNKVPEKYLPEDYIKGLITEELGVIENGTY